MRVEVRSLPQRHRERRGKFSLRPLCLCGNFLLLSLLMTGCRVGPNYEAPENCVADEWHSTDGIVDDAPVIDWWSVFNDPLLSKYIGRAAENNKNVLSAKANIVQARASRQVTAADWYPHIGADIAAGEFRFSKNGLVFGPLAASAKGPKAQGLFNVLFDAVWELDLFGKTARAVDAADAAIGSTIENRNEVLISVMAELARNYIEIRSSQKNVSLTQGYITLLEQQLAIVQKQLQFGYVSLLNYELVQANLANARATLPDLTADIYSAIYAISVLTGDVPETLLDELLVDGILPSVPETVAVGLRSDLLRRRPDVRMAERQLAIATANLGVSVAQFFPSIAFGAIGGLQSLHLDNLFTAGSNIWGYGGNASVPLFEGGKLVGNYHVEKAALESQFQLYQQTVLKALEEAEAALISYAQEKATAREYGEAVKRYGDLAGLSKQRYEKGLTNKIDFLNSEMNLISSEQNLLSSDTAALIDLIALYKALGGGWESSCP